MIMKGCLPQLRYSDPAGMICTAMDGPFRLPCFTLRVALTGAVQLRAEGIASCFFYIVNVHNHPL
jgi:hypothetical protein